jgi:hypothetical protein
MKFMEVERRREIAEISEDLSGKILVAWGGGKGCEKKR